MMIGIVVSLLNFDSDIFFVVSLLFEFGLGLGILFVGNIKLLLGL